MIDAETFEKATGRAPENDDLERSNCPQSGEPGHRQCGWCNKHNGPIFQCGCYLDNYNKPKVYHCPRCNSQAVIPVVYTGLDCTTCGETRPIEDMQASVYLVRTFNQSTEEDTYHYVVAPNEEEARVFVERRFKDEPETIADLVVLAENVLFAFN